MIEEISQALYEKGFCVVEQALPNDLSEKLGEYAKKMSSRGFKRAGVGRDDNKNLYDDIRRDSILWIDGVNDIEQAWLDWAQTLKQVLNRKLYLGLDYFESHFAYYKEGEFYKKHLDAFQGQSNRKLSLVTYLNPEWEIEYGGELLIYSPTSNEIVKRVWPQLGTVVVFLSEEFPHEVLPASRDRYSIAGWFR